VIALVIAGLVMAAVIVWGVFISRSFLGFMAQPDHARGLITFLFSFATIGIFVLVAIAVFWLPPPEVEVRFRNAKDLITILVGVLGTVIGFYFGTAATSGTPLSVTALTIPKSVAAGDKATISGRAAGGAGGYQCEIQISPASAIDAKTIDCKVSSDGQISAELPIPDIKTQTELSVKVIVRDGRGSEVDSPEAKLTVTPK